MKVFERPGPVNTMGIIEIALIEAEKYRYIAVASVTDDSAVKLAERVKDKNIICVTCPQGMFWEADKMGRDIFAEIPELSKIRDDWLKNGLKTVPMEITEENKIKLEKLGVKTVRGTIPFFGPSFSMRLHLQHISSMDILAKTLELISTGTLVCLESVLMCTDAGVIPENENVLALAGTERGLDTAWIIRSSASANLFHPQKGCRFVELFAKPGISIQPDIKIEYLR